MVNFTDKSMVVLWVLSTKIADLALLQLGNKVIQTWTSQFLVVLDTIIFGISSNKIEYTCHKFNSYHNRLQFAKEQPNNNSINFLDITISLENKISHTASGRYLDFMYFVPLKFQTSVINNLVYKAILLSNKNFKLIV